MRRAFVLLVLLLTACEGSFIRAEDLGRKTEINKSYEARDTCLKHQAVADGTAGVDPATLAHAAALTCQGETDRLIAAANDTIDGLAAGVWSRDIAKANQLANAIRAGSVWINCYHVFDAALPFGGYKLSGLGRENSKAAIEHYTQIKSVYVNLGRVEAPY